MTKRSKIIKNDQKRSKTIKNDHENATGPQTTKNDHETIKNDQKRSKTIRNDHSTAAGSTGHQNTIKTSPKHHQKVTNQPGTKPPTNQQVTRRARHSTDSQLHWRCPGRRTPPPDRRRGHAAEARQTPQPRPGPATSPGPAPQARPAQTARSSKAQRTSPESCSRHRTGPKVAVDTAGRHGPDQNYAKNQATHTGTPNHQNTMASKRPKTMKWPNPSEAGCRSLCLRRALFAP